MFIDVVNESAGPQSAALLECAVEPHVNSVVLIGHYGGDETHAQSAWVSTDTVMSETNRSRVPKLLKILADNKHFSPFEKSVLHFRINTDLPLHLQAIKHRAGVSVNAESARYREIKDDDYYLPADWPEEWRAELKRHTEASLRLYHDACAALTPILGRQRTKESARFFRPMNAQIASDISFNWRSFAHFYRLRAAPDAQAEIREVAERMLELVRAIPGNPFEHTIAAFEM